MHPVLHSATCMEYIYPVTFGFLILPLLTTEWLSWEMSSNIAVKDTSSEMSVKSQTN